MTDATPADRARAKELRAIERAYQRAAKRTEELREARNAAVAEALAGGWSHGRIADATGMTRGRVGQLAQRGHVDAQTTAANYGHLLPDA